MAVEGWVVVVQWAEAEGWVVRVVEVVAVEACLVPVAAWAAVEVVVVVAAAVVVAVADAVVVEVDDEEAVEEEVDDSSIESRISLGSALLNPHPPRNDASLILSFSDAMFTR